LVEQGKKSQEADATSGNQTPALDKPIDIFLSYNRSDTPIMRRLRADLRAAGFTVWTDDVGLEPGTPRWQRTIEEAIRQARCMVVVLSPEANASEWVSREVSYAETLGLRIFPVLAKGDANVAVPINLINHQRIDLRFNYQKAVVEQLIPALQRHLLASNPESTNTARRTISSKADRSASPLSGSWWMRLDLGNVLSLLLGIALLFVLALNNRLWQNFFGKGSSLIPTSSISVTLPPPTQVALVSTATAPPPDTLTPKPQPTNTPAPATATALPTATPSAPYSYVISNISTAAYTYCTIYSPLHSAADCYIT